MSKTVVRANDVVNVGLQEVRYKGIAGELVWRFGMHETLSGREGEAVEVENNLDWGWLIELGQRDNDDFLDQVMAIFDQMGDADRTDPPYGGIAIDYDTDGTYIGWEWGDLFIACFPGGRVRVGRIGS